MVVKADLKIVLKANDVEIAESEDAELWQRVLTAITGSRAAGAPLAASRDEENAGLRKAAPLQANDPVSRFAAEAAVAVEELVGGISPTVGAPYLVLDAHCWEAMKNQLPSRGVRAISPIQLSATLLGLWSHYASLNAPSQATAQAVLNSLRLRDPNAVRGLRAASWLQARPGGTFNINPAQMSRATSIARAFCKKDWSRYMAEDTQ